MTINRDINILHHIIKHCHQIELTRNFLGDSYDQFESNFIFFNAITANVTQIGELANKLSKNFMIAHKNIPWNQIIKLRHIAVHHYEKLDLKLLWKIITSNTPELKIFCQNQLNILKAQETTKEIEPQLPRPKF